MNDIQRINSAIEAFAYELRKLHKQVARINSLGDRLIYSAFLLGFVFGVGTGIIIAMHSS